MEERPYPGTSIDSAASATSSTGVEVEAFMTLGCLGDRSSCGPGRLGPKEIWSSGERLEYLVSITIEEPLNIP